MEVDRILRIQPLARLGGVIAAAATGEVAHLAAAFAAFEPHAFLGGFALISPRNCFALISCSGLNKPVFSNLFASLAE